MHKLYSCIRYLIYIYFFFNFCVKALVGLEKDKREEAMKGAQVDFSTFLSILVCDIDGFVSLMKTNPYIQEVYIFMRYRSQMKKCK